MDETADERGQGPGRAGPLRPVAGARARGLPVMALGVVALFAGLWGGLIRLGLTPDTAVASAAQLHGPLMALGFLGTLVSLERAVALGRWWGYAAPIGAGAGALAALAGAPGSLGPALVTLGGLVFLGSHLTLHRLAPSVHNAVMALGALAWCAAAAMWVAGLDVSRFAPLLAGFLVLTVAGERLELNRVSHRGQGSRRLLLAAIALFAAGLAVSIPAERAGVRIAGIGLVAQALWLARHDVARRTVRIGGVTRFIAVALLAGYAWLACAGVLWAADAPLGDGAAYDAALHALFLGFVMSMVFAHAPVIVPAIVRAPLAHRRRFYVHLTLLHASLAVRLVGGDLAGDRALWRWGGVGNEAAILLFLAVTAAGLAGARGGSEARRREQAGAAAIPPAPAHR